MLAICFIFAWLPVESIIHDHQQEYYDAINASNDAGESTAFIEFMLSVIKASLIDTIHTSDAMSDGKMDKKTLRWQKIEQFLRTHEYIMNADVRGFGSDGKSDIGRTGERGKAIQSSRKRALGVSTSF